MVEDSKIPTKVIAAPRGRPAGPLVAVGTIAGDTYLVTLDGECDLTAHATLQDAFDRAVKSPCATIEVDLSACMFLDSTGLGALIHLNRRISRQIHRDLEIVPGPPQVQRVFEVCDLLDVLPFRTGTE
jgi:anti-anti-sigma factor